MRINILLLLLPLFLCGSNKKASKDDNIPVFSEVNEPSENNILLLAIFDTVNNFYNYYFRWPKDVKELYSFYDNSYDYQYFEEPLKSHFKKAIDYLKEREEDISILSYKGFFFLHSSKDNQGVTHTEYICDPERLEIIMYPENNTNFYNSNGRNISEIIGTSESEKIRKHYRSLLKDVPFEHIKGRSLEMPGNTKWLLYPFKYIRNTGLEPLCEDFGLISFDYNQNYLLNIVEKTKHFLTDYPDINEVIFSLHIEFVSTCE